MKDMIVNASMILQTALMPTDDNDKEKEGANQTLQAEVIFRDV